MNKAVLHEQGRYRPIVPDNPKPDDNWPYHNHPTTPHDREFGIKNPKFERHIFIRRDQILYDIDAQISMMSKARRRDDGTEDDTFSNATQTYQQQFYRWIDKHIGIAKNKMQSFVLEKFKTTKMDSISQAEEVDIELLMPEWWDDTIFDQLVAAVHDYVVNATLYEFFCISLVAPSRYGVAQDPATLVKQQQMNDGLEEIKKLANSAKPGRIRKPFKPF